MSAPSPSRVHPIDKPLPKGKAELNLSTFAFLFSEIIQYNQTRVQNIGELERRLEDLGHGVGASLLELLCWRERGGKRTPAALDALKFVHSSLWRALFGRQAKDLEQSNTAEDEYMISDFDLPLLKFVSVPRDFRGLNCAAFAAGAVRGALAAAGFPARVTAHFVPVKGGDPKKPKTTILIKFDASVMAREAGKWAG